MLLNQNVLIRQVQSDSSIKTYVVIMKNREILNNVLIKKGYARVSQLTNDNIDLDLLLLQDEAKADKRGIWNSGIVYFHKTPGNEYKNIAAHYITDSSEAKYYYALMVVCIIGCLVFFIKYYRSNKRKYLYFFLTSSVFNSAVYLFIPIILQARYVNLLVAILSCFLIVYLLIHYIRDVQIKDMNVKKTDILISSMVAIVVIVFTFANGYLYVSNSEDIRERVLIPLNSEHSTIQISKPTTNFLDIQDKYIEDDVNRNLYYLEPRNALYFSAVTFFTVGYGDITPKGFLIEVAEIEMVLGYLLQIYIISNLAGVVFKRDL
jgi:hypothetical protein